MPFRMKAGTPKRLPCRASAREISSVRSRLDLGGRTGGTRVGWIFAGHHAKRDRGVGHVAGNGTGVVQQPVERCDPCDADKAASRKYADHGTRRRRHPDGVACIRSGAQDCEVRGNRGYGASGRSSRTEANIIGIAGASEGSAASGIAVGKVGHVGLSEDHGASCAQFYDHGCVPAAR